jgi:pimeloyl-ACP methyl ester carboxylesterase
MFPAGVEGIRARQTLLASGLRLRIAEAGDPSAPPILLVHGWGASLYMWRDWFAPLAAAGRRVLAVDLPGHGLSDKPDDPATYRLNRQVDVLRELMDAEGLARVDVVAQSMAGTVALELALLGEPRLRRLALVNPACFGRIRLQRLARAVSPSMVDGMLPRLVSRWVVARAHRLVYGDPTRITARDEDEYWAPSQFPSYARAMRRLLHEFQWGRPPAEPMAERLRVLPRPVLVVLGTRDRLVRDARPYVEGLVRAGAPLVVRDVEGGGHAVNEERPAEVVSLVEAFLASSS